MKLLRIVTQLCLDQDPRGPDRRPLASDVLLSFWKYVAGRPVISLRGIIFQTVEETGTVHITAQVYRNLGQARTVNLGLRRHSEETEKAEFDRVHKGTKLGRIVRTMATEYIEMKEVNARVENFDFVPHSSRGRKFHLVVTFAFGG